MIDEDGSPFTIAEWPARIALDTGQALSNVTMGVQHADGTLTWLDVNVQPLFDDGETAPYAVVTSFFDITRRRQTEAALREATAEAERANRAKSDFPRGSATSCARPSTPSSASPNCWTSIPRPAARRPAGRGRAHPQAKHLLALINEVLDRRIESGGSASRPSRVEVREVLIERLDHPTARGTARDHAG